MDGLEIDRCYVMFVLYCFFNVCFGCIFVGRGVGLSSFFSQFFFGGRELGLFFSGVGFIG